MAVRCQFDRKKSRDVKRKHGGSLSEAREIFDQVYICDQKNDDPEQFRAIGWCRGRLCSVVFEIRRDAGGEYYHLVTVWRSTEQEIETMPKTPKKKISADEIAAKTSRGEDVSSYFSNQFTVVRPLHRVNIDLTHGMLRDLDERAARLNISRQAVIKTLLGRALNEDRPKPRGRRAG